ncbi:MAG: MerR family transcriptional regulator [Saprospiraceae bacterium]|jgi:DNA-binding transcriptional MerR regulator
MDNTPLTKLYYAIGEVADLLQVAPSVIRYWESEFQQIHPAKNSKGERKYTAKDIEMIRHIYHLVKEKGFTIEGAKKELDAEKHDKKEKNQLLSKLQHLKKMAEAMKANLEQ